MSSRPAFGNPVQCLAPPSHAAGRLPPPSSGSAGEVTDVTKAPTSGGISVRSTSSKAQTVLPGVDAARSHARRVAQRRSPPSALNIDLRQDARPRLDRSPPCGYLQIDGDSPRPVTDRRCANRTSMRGLCRPRPVPSNPPRRRRRPRPRPEIRSPSRCPRWRRASARHHFLICLASRRNAVSGSCFHLEPRGCLPGELQSLFSARLATCSGPSVGAGAGAARISPRSAVCESGVE